MRDDSLNLNVYSVRTEITDPSMYICSTDEKNLKSSWLTKIYRRAVPWTSTNQKASSSMNFLRRTAIPNQKTSLSTIFLWRKTNHNALLTNKKTKILRLHVICQSNLTPLMYSKVEQIFWTDLPCYMKDCA